MKIIEPSVELWKQENDIAHAVRCARVCYKRETGNDEATYKFEIGKGVVLKEGTDVTIVATGLCVSESLEAAKLLEADGISTQVMNIHTIKPLDEELILAAAKKTNKIVTVEEHSIIGGLGGAVSELLSEKAPTKMLRIGVMDTFGESGPAAE